MGFVEIIGVCFDAFPIVRRIWRWMWERNMEIEIHAPHSHAKGKFPIPSLKDSSPIWVVHVGQRPHIYMWIDLLLINHKTDRKERIISCMLHLKKRHWLFWDKTIAEAQVRYLIQYDEYTPITDIPLEPLSAPTVLTVKAEGPITEPVASLPRKMTLVLEFRMVGPIRRMRRIVESIHHNPKQLTPQKEGSQT